VAGAEPNVSPGRPHGRDRPGWDGSWEPALVANVVILVQTAPDCLRALLQVGGSPFDYAGLGSTDRMRMACKRPGVRVPLAPLHFRSQISNTEPIVINPAEGQNEGQGLQAPCVSQPARTSMAVVFRPAVMGLATCKRSRACPGGRSLSLAWAPSAPLLPLAR
jgi:hypothetical protein